MEIKQFEYDILVVRNQECTKNISNRLNMMGANGWELVGVINRDNDVSCFGTFGNYIFKREKISK